MKLTHTMLGLALAGWCLGLAVSGAAETQIPQRMNFQGLITDSGGTPVNGSLNLIFRIYDQSSGGTMRWTETQNGVTVNDGIFNVVLGTVNAIDLPFRREYWLTFEVQSEGVEFAPRHLLSNAAYAMAARKIVYQEVITVAQDGGDTCTVSAALGMLGTLSPGPNPSTQVLIDVQAGTYNEPGSLVVPSWVTIRGQGWENTTLVTPQVDMSSAAGTGLEDLLIESAGGNPVVSLAGASDGTVRDCRIRADNPGPVIDLSSSADVAILGNELILTGPPLANTGGIVIANVSQGRIENNTIDTRAVTGMVFGISDMGTPAQQVEIVENTIRYMGDGSNIGIGLTQDANQDSRIAFNVFMFGGNQPNRDIIDLGTGAFPVNPPWPPVLSGYRINFNLGSDGVALPAF